MGAAMRAHSSELKGFLFRELYRHPQVTGMTDLARTVVTELFTAYLAQPNTMPNTMPSDHAGGPRLPRQVADYIAGMTDRFALREHQRLTGRRLFDL